MKRIIILGGGVAGLITSIELAREGIECLLFEKRNYPFHRVCGEYISNEAVPFLRSKGLYPDMFDPPVINRFMLSSVSGKKTTLPLDLGGFGISRYAFDNFLFQKAREAGVVFHLNTSVDNVAFSDQAFKVTSTTKEFEADLVIASFGKRSNLDVRLQRKFIKKRSPYLGVKYHVRSSHPLNLVALHNFPGGYCGVSRVEDNRTNICYLVHRDKLRRHKSIGEMEAEVLFKNPLIKEIYNQSEFLFDKPETINEISFETKGPVEDHMLMVGDAAGMITPLCGNGMAMAINASRIASTLTVRFCKDKQYTRRELEYDYARMWTREFRSRLWAGRQIQRLFGSELASLMAINLAINFQPVAQTIIRNTHGKPF